MFCKTPLFLEDFKNKYSKNQKMSMQIITHNDMDGYTSAAVVYNAFHNAGIINSNDLSIGHYNYSDHIPTIDRSKDIIFITDYSISNKAFRNDLLDAYNNGTNMFIYWCDHHQTSIDLCTGKYESLKKIEGIRDTRYCGAALAYFYLTPGSDEKHLPYFLTLVDDFDCWKKEFKASDELNVAFGFNLKYRNKFMNITSDLYTMLINDQPKSKNYFEDILTYGENYIKYSKDTNKINIRNYGWIGEFDKFPGIKILCLNTAAKYSQSFADLFKSKEYPNGKYKYACAFSFDGTQFTYSVYTSEKCSPNAQKICEAYGGGGHPGASGFTSSKIVIRKVDEIPEMYKQF